MFFCRPGEWSPGRGEERSDEDGKEKYIKIRGKEIHIPYDCPDAGSVHLLRFPSYCIFTAAER